MSLLSNTEDWRIIYSPPAVGAWNMALDEALLESAIAGNSPPTLRLYSWEPACLSLGIAQTAADVDYESLKNYGWDLVRRPTGGRAILHTDELTYAVIGSSDNAILAGGVLESYRRISLALMRALEILGLNPTSHQHSPSQSTDTANAPVCFQVPSRYEITAGGKKLVGSAQARRKNGVLQHGSLPLTGDLTRITWALYYPSDAARYEDGQRLLDHATTLEAITGQIFLWSQVASAFHQAFKQVFSICMQPSQPEPGELARAEEFIREKYATDRWNLRV